MSERMNLEAERYKQSKEVAPRLQKGLKTTMS